MITVFDALASCCRVLWNNATKVAKTYDSQVAVLSCTFSMLKLRSFISPSKSR